MVHLLADIQLEHDEHGRISAARGSNGDVVRYTYDVADHLQTVDGDEAKVRYSYAGELVKRIERSDGSWKEFVCTERGELQRARSSNGIDLLFRLRHTGEGTDAVATSANGEWVAAVRYGTAMTPIAEVSIDGTRTDWTQLSSGTVQRATRWPDGRCTKVFRSVQGDQEVAILPDGGAYRFVLDAGGNVTTMVEGNVEVLRQSYHRGQLKSAETETTLVRCIHDEGRILDAIVLSSPDEQQQNTQWMKVELDDMGRADRVTDYYHLQFRLGYDDRGDLMVCGKTVRPPRQMTRNGL